ncbi:atzF [Symbiodinium sp. CCMP2592]|nr:atzF [Symbiodinium sp. CCMP2592]
MLLSRLAGRSDALAIFCPKFGIPSRQFLDFTSFGSAAQARAKEYAAAWDRSVEALQAIGGTCVEVDYSPFQEAANLLYQGPWVAERLAAIAALLQEDPEVIEPTVRKIVEQGHHYTAQQCFEASYRMRALHRAAEASMEAAKAQVLVTPTVGATYKIEDVLADPIALNTNLGRFTNHMNLLDLCGLAVPTMWAGEALPFGVTISAQAGSDAYICDIGQRLHAFSGLPVGALEAAVEDVEAAVAAKMGTFYGPLPSGVDTFEVAVCGAHMAGLPLSPQLTERGGRFMREARTSPRYRLVAFDEMKPPRPGLVDAADGASIDLEIWELPASSFGSFMKLVASPLGIGWIELEDGSRVQGFRQVDASVNRGGQVGVASYEPNKTLYTVLRQHSKTTMACCFDS